MNSQAIQNKLNEYYNTATPEQVVKEFEDLGVKFVKTENMNLIQQLQKTPKWKEFEEWYNKYLTTLSTCTVGDKVHLDNINKDNLNDLHGGCVYEVNFCFLPPEFTKGVFEKFIEQKFEIHFDSSYTLYHKHVWEYVIDNNKLLRCSSFEELLIWYFNN